jgi:hypothetical protein
MQVQAAFAHFLMDDIKFLLPTAAEPPRGYAEYDAITGDKDGKGSLYKKLSPNQNETNRI